jgi:RluA family pseudouridine synthase
MSDDTENDPQAPGPHANALPGGEGTITLLDVLVKKYPESSRTKLREVIAAKRVLVNGKTAVTLKQPIAPNATVEVLDRLTARTRVAGNVPYHVVFEDADLLVIDKPHGFITSSGPNDRRATVFTVLSEHYAKIDDRIQLGLIHRLDKDASGLLVFSKSQRAYESLKAQFADKRAKRTYHAIVHGAPDPKEDTIEDLLVEFADGTVHSTRNVQHGEQAITHYRTLEKRKEHTLLEVRLETGRKHQIRVHLADRGWPIAGDPTYHPHANQAPRLMLVAIELSLEHPRSGERVTWRIDPPANFITWWDDQLPRVHGRPRKGGSR